jgi:hypothetical protein
MPLLSCVCCTYGRFTLLRRSVAFWLYQDYEPKELVIFNTAPVPLELDAALQRHGGIRVVNQTGHSESGAPFASLGEVRASALGHARGDVYVCWDDDDMFLPWHLSQGMRELDACGRSAWMPAQSYASMDGGRTYALGRNSFEASVLVRMGALRRYGFDTSGRSGAEHLPWRQGLVRDGELSEECDVAPFESYAYIWGDPGHKTSGTIDLPDNFAVHQRESADFGHGALSAELPHVVERYYTNVSGARPHDALRERLNRYLVTTRV